MTQDPFGESDEQVIPLAEETAIVAKEKVITGRVRVQTRTEEIATSVREDLAYESVEVERVRLDRMIGPDEPVPQERTEGDITIIPVFEEVLVVEKRLVLREEIHLTRTRAKEHIEQPVVLRKQRALVERTAENALPPTTTE